MPLERRPLEAVAAGAVVLSGVVNGRMRLVATILLDEWIRPQRGRFFRRRASGPLCLPFASIKWRRGAALHRQGAPDPTQVALTIFGGPFSLSAALTSSSSATMSSRKPPEEERNRFRTEASPFLQHALKRHARASQLWKGLQRRICTAARAFAPRLNARVRQACEMGLEGNRLEARRQPIFERKQPAMASAVIGGDSGVEERESGGRSRQALTGEAAGLRTGGRRLGLWWTPTPKRPS